jgi:hypothetical protein
MQNDDGRSKPRKSMMFRMSVSGSVFCILLCALLVAGSGCGTPGPQIHGPSAPAVTRTEPWSYENDPGVVIHTAHYDLYTTIADIDIRRRLADVMEGALGEYQRIAPGVPISSRPMECYIFKNREEWVHYTREHTGIDSYIYLQISRGGYTVRDWYAGYYLGSVAATMSVAAHEGWHQFASRNFKGRLPPFLEEGIATMFEDLTWENDLPRWNLTQNRSRLQSLRGAVEGNYVYSLEDLSQKHAGNVVAQSGNRVEAFYGESWAFATFLWAADDGKYRPILRQMISDIADGSVYDPTGVHKDSHLPWSPAGVKPMLEHYLGMSLDQVNVEYQKYIRKVAFDDYAAQWN